LPTHVSEDAVLWLMVHASKAVIPVIFIIVLHIALQVNIQVSK